MKGRLLVGTTDAGRPFTPGAGCVRRLAGRVVLPLLLLGGPLLSGGAAEAQGRWTPSLQLDNDFYNVWRRHTQRPDEEYTNGVRASLISHGGSWWGERLARGIPDCADAARATPACRATTVTFGQELYTPNLDRAPYTVPDWELERPFHAWLYVAGTAQLLSRRVRRDMTLSLGVTGPPAGGALAQGIAHRIGWADPATGWETQVGFEPGLMLGYRQSVYAVRLGGPQRLAFDLAPELAVSLGNIRTGAELGGRVRLGWNLSHPWSPAAWRDRTQFEWWVSAGGRLSYVARDMSLDGTLRSPTRRVERLSGVRQYEIGVGVRLRAVTLEYAAVTRSREYRTGPGHHAHGSIMVGIVAER